MSKLDNITFHGDEQVILDAPDVAKVLRRHAKDDPGAKLDVYVNPRIFPRDPLVWSLRVTSPRGLRHLEVTQRKPYGSVLIK
jgi:hypothetical protein